MQIGKKKPKNQDHRDRQNGYYQTKAHKLWRSAVAEKSNWLCVHCLSPSIKNRDGSYSRQINPGKVADHIIPISKGGSKTDLNNGQFLCRYHDSIKSNKDKQL